jgi:hypothetical protein
MEGKSMRHFIDIKTNTIITALVTCLMVPAVAQPAKKEINYDGMLALVGRFSVATGCPVSATRALTSAHVTDPRWFDSKAPLWPFRFENALGEEGIAAPMSVRTEADLGWLALRTPVSVWYSVASEKPKVGDKVFWREYEIQKEDKFFTFVERDSEIVSVVAGSFYTKRIIRQGASGGCVFNEAGEILGLATMGYTIGYTGDAGGFIGVWGHWYTPPPGDEK